ncbi:MAG: hypothetical protein KJO50_03845, partial [Bacteroidia bacterium]|nr:hypothetical protein [Bacteroidia bacterium]
MKRTQLYYLCCFLFINFSEALYSQDFQLMVKQVQDCFVEGEQQQYQALVFSTEPFGSNRHCVVKDADGNIIHEHKLPAESLQDGFIFSNIQDSRQKISVELASGNQLIEKVSVFPEFKSIYEINVNHADHNNIFGSIHVKTTDKKEEITTVWEDGFIGSYRSNLLPGMYEFEIISSDYCNQNMTVKVDNLNSPPIIDGLYRLQISEACTSDGPVELIPIEFLPPHTPLPSGGVFSIVDCDN